MELLAIVGTLKEYCSMLLGADLTVFTDHENLTYENFNTQRVMRWRCHVEEFSPKIKYLEGKLNVLANPFSRMPRTDLSPFTVPNVSVDKKTCCIGLFHGSSASRQFKGCSQRKSFIRPNTVVCPFNGSIDIIMSHEIT